MTQNLFWILSGICICLACASVFLRQTIYAIACQTGVGIVFALILANNEQTYAAFVVFALTVVLFALLLMFSLMAGEGENAEPIVSKKMYYFVISLVLTAMTGTVWALQQSHFYFRAGGARIRRLQMIDLGKELFENNPHLLWLMGILLIMGCVGVSVLLAQSDTTKKEDTLHEINEGAENVGQ